MNAKWMGTIAIALLAATPGLAQNWRQVGPPGGTVISLEADPRNPDKLYLGTQDGHVFTSKDDGKRWQLLSRIGTGQDDVITHILVDSQKSNRLYASTWTLGSEGGGVYRSDDSGQTWQVIGLAHETVRAIAQAPTNPRIFVAGSLTGVYRSMDEGATWQRITPANHEDLRNFDSVAFDPRDENIIYAGTYHLPWKTINGGKDWFPISKGMIDDSDVMSIVVDPANPENVHATACSGIYHSTNGAQAWSKYKGIPFAFRRTQLIRQDPQHPETLYAGTTSGLWKTTNEGVEWKRVTPGDWVINAVVIDPRNTQRVVLGTEREGVQITENAGVTFTAANNGFEHQHILDVAIDQEHPDRALVVLTFDTNAFLATKDGGTTWAPLGPGLKRTELKHVYATPTGWWAALANGGWMKYEETNGKWMKAGLLVSDPVVTPAPTTKSKGKMTTVAAKRPVPAVRAKTQSVAFQVNDMAFAPDAWYAATTAGVLRSQDRGATWKFASKDDFARAPVEALEASQSSGQVWAIAGRNLLHSADGGAQWEAKPLPFPAAVVNLKLRRVDDQNLFITSSQGLYDSKDGGKNWSRENIRQLQFQDVAGAHNALVVSLQKHGLLESLDAGESWQVVKNPLADGYFPVVRVERNGALVAVSATEGLLTMDANANPHSADSSGGGMAQTSAGSGEARPQH